MNYQEDVMLNITLPFAINDLEGNELLTAGSLLDETTINAVAAQGRQKQYKASCLLQHGSIRSDIESFMQVNPYASIFGDAEGLLAYLERIGEILVPQPLLSALDDFKENDFYTYRHSLIVFALTAFMMEKSFPGKILEKNALLVGPTHDLGKRSVPVDILNKKTPLTRSERCILEFHPIAGYVLLSYYLGDPRHPAAQVALNHHERRNGSGYPRGISELDPLVEMVATCDVYDALISSRPYRQGTYDNRTALEELSAIAETGALDVYCVQVLVGRNRAGHPAPDQVKISPEKRGTPPTNNCYAQTVDE